MIDAIAIEFEGIDVHMAKGEGKKMKYNTEIWKVLSHLFWYVR